jgi:hypothetical protein
MTIRYTIEVIRSGQPRAYADTTNEYLIKGEQLPYNKTEFVPYLPLGDVEAIIAHETKMRERRKMFGGYSPEGLRAEQRKAALRLVRTLCQDFREQTDEDGRTGMEAHFYPTLQFLAIDGAAGTIRVVIVEPFTD